MKPSAWSRVQEVFEEALDVPRAQRALVLAARLGGEPGMLRQVEALLRAHDEALPEEERGEEAQADGEGFPAVPRFEITRELGAGGMGTVYLAEQREPVRRRVALKVVKLGMDSREVLARFEAERQALASMSHPAIARVFDVGRTRGGRPFFAMEYVPGVPLHEYCDEHRLSIAERLVLFAGVCRGVHHAHQKGIVHRDLKPSNVLVLEVDGRPLPKIIDFGVSKALQAPLTEAALRTQLGDVVGTPAYMSPEQADLSQAVDTRSDVYSLGVLLYELLVGQPPFDTGELMRAGLSAVLETLRTKDPPRPSTRFATARTARTARAARAASGQSGDTSKHAAAARRSDPPALARRLRGDLDWIALRCLEREPDRRYQSASELASDIERHLRDEPVEAAPPGIGYVALKALRRHRAAALAGALVLAALVAGLTAALWQYRVARASAEEAREALAGERAARRVADGHRLSAQALALAADDPALALLLAIEGSERAPGEGARGALYAALEHHREVARWSAHDGTVQRFVLAPDGARALSSDWTGELIAWDLARGAVLWRSDEHAGIVDEILFWPGGARALSVSYDATARVWDAATGACLAVLEHPARVRVAALVSADRVVTGCDDGKVRVWDATAAEVAQVLAEHARPVEELACSADGAVVLSADAAYEFQVCAPGSPVARRVPVAGGEPPQIYNLDVWYAPFAAVTGDGTRLVTRSRTGVVEVWDARSLRRLQAHGGPGDFCSAAALSQDGSRLFVHRLSGSGRVLDAATGTLVSELRGHPVGERGRAYFAPDGRTLATAPEWDDVEVWDVASGRHRASFTGLARGVQHVAFTADGEVVYAAGHDGDVRRFQVAAYPESRALARRPELERIAYDPAGRAALVLARREDGSGRIALVDVASGDPLLDLGAAARPPRARFDRSGRRLAVWDAGTERLALWDVAARRMEAEVALEHADELDFSPDGESLVVVDRPRLLVLDARSGERRTAFEVDEGCYRAALAPGARIAATADGARHTARLWNVRSGQLLAELGGHSSWVFDVDFDATGERLLSFANDTSACVWDVATFELARRFDSLPTAEHASAAFGPRGERAVVATPGAVLVLDLAHGRRDAAWTGAVDYAVDGVFFAPEGDAIVAFDELGVARRLTLDPLARARELAPRPLTAAEMARYDVGTAGEREARARAAERAEGSPAALVRAAAARVDAGDPETALELLARARELRPRQPAAHDWTTALAHGRRALQLRAAGREAGAQVAAALAALAEAIAKGFADAAAIERSGHLELVREDVGYSALVRRMR